MKQAVHFSIQELVDRTTYTARGNKAWQLIDDRLITVIDLLRDELGKITINNWQWGGDRQYSGLRTKDSPHHRDYSQHSFGRAVDMIFAEYTAQEVRDWLKANANYVCSKCDIKGFTVEEGVDWVHLDLRNSGAGYNSFNP